MSTSVRRASRAAAMTFTCMLALPFAAFANGHHDRAVIETVYSPSVLAVPTAYVTTSSYLPTAYVESIYPTVYTPTSVVTSSYVVQPTSYLVSSSYVTRSRRAYRPLFGWRRTAYLDTYSPTSYVTTTYWPTTTTLDLPVVESLTPTISYADDCGMVVGTAPAAGSSPSATPSQNSRPGAPPASLSSQPSASGAASQPSPNSPPPNSGVNPPTNINEPGLEIPQGPVPDNDIELPGMPPAADQVTPPSGTTDLSVQRSVNRPAPTDLRPASSVSAVGTLRGQVLTGPENLPVSAAKVVFEDAMKRYAPRTAITDADGHFDVLLPDGDWMVNVEETDGTLTPYSTITVASGRFFQGSGRVVTSLRLHH